MYNFIVIFLSILLYMTDKAFPSLPVPTDNTYAFIRGQIPVSRLLVTLDLLINFLHTVIHISTSRCGLENTAAYNIRLERAES